MKAERISHEVESIKDRLAEAARGNLGLFFEQMDDWLKQHPHAGPTVNSPAQLRTRVRKRAATQRPAPPGGPYRVYDPVIAQVHQAREKLYRSAKDAELVLKDEPALTDCTARKGPYRKKA